MPSAKPQEVSNLIESEIDGPEALTVAIWYCVIGPSYQRNVMGTVARAYLVQATGISVEEDTETVFHDGTSFLFSQGILPAFHSFPE